MDAVEYIKKSKAICKKYVDKECPVCPLRGFGCGIPEDHGKIEVVVEMVDKFTLEESNSTCPVCSYDFLYYRNDMEGLNFCPICGTKVEK